MNWQSGRLDVFYRGADSTIWHVWQFGLQLPWYAESIGGSLSSAPAVVSPAANRFDVFAAGISGALQHACQPDALHWFGWETMPGQAPASGPAALAVDWQSGRLDTFYRGSDSAIWHNWQVGLQLPWGSERWAAR